MMKDNAIGCSKMLNRFPEAAAEGKRRRNRQGSASR
jgi:hypothetical protein